MNSMDQRNQASEMGQMGGNLRFSAPGFMTPQVGSKLQLQMGQMGQMGATGQLKFSAPGFMTPQVGSRLQIVPGWGQGQMAGGI